MAPMKPIPDQLTERIEIQPGGCWLWTGAVNNGYGRLYCDGRLVYAHRAVYEEMVGPIPDGRQLDHRCRVTRCVNPAHLEPVSNRENGRRGIKGVLTTQCPNGHVYTDENTMRRPNGHRRCRRCHNTREEVRRRSKNANQN